MNKPSPKKITLGSEAKHFQLDDGMSNGSSVSMTFDIPDDLPNKDLVMWMYAEKEKLDLFVLSAEHLKGALGRDDYIRRKTQIKAAYDTLLHRRSDDEISVAAETDE